jgi:hypothetical protein
MSISHVKTLLWNADKTYDKLDEYEYSSPAIGRTEDNAKI